MSEDFPHEAASVFGRFEDMLVTLEVPTTRDAGATNAVGGVDRVLCERRRDFEELYVWASRK